MATVRIGEKDLDVKPTTLGFIKRKLLPAQRAIDEAKDELSGGEGVIAMLFLYVGHNDAVSLEWLEDNVLVRDFARLLRECALAAGQRAPEGEAKSQ